jgi:hypothetical protein
MEVSSGSRRSTDCLWIDYATSILKSNVKVGAEEIGDLDSPKVDLGFEQIYKASDQPTGGFSSLGGKIWIRMPERKEITYFDVLQRCRNDTIWLWFESTDI